MKESLSSRSKPKSSPQIAQRQAIDKASQLINTLMEELSEQKKRYSALQQQYFTLHYQHQQLQGVLAQKQTLVSEQQQHIRIEQNKIKELHLEIAKLFQTNQALREGISKGKMKNITLEEENQYLLKRSFQSNEGAKQDTYNPNKIEFTFSTEFDYEKNSRADEPSVLFRNISERLANTETKPNRRRLYPKAYQYDKKSIPEAAQF